MYFTLLDLERNALSYTEACAAGIELYIHKLPLSRAACIDKGIKHVRVYWIDSDGRKTAKDY